MATRDEIQQIDAEKIEVLSQKYNCAKMDEVEFQNRVHIARITSEGTIDLERTPEGDDLLATAQYEAGRALKRSLPVLLVILALTAAYIEFNYFVLKVSDSTAGAMVLFGGAFSAAFSSVDSSWQRLKRVSQELGGKMTRTEKFYKKKILKCEFERVGNEGEILLLTEAEAWKRKRAEKRRGGSHRKRTPNGNR